MYFDPPHALHTQLDHNGEIFVALHAYLCEVPRYHLAIAHKPGCGPNFDAGSGLISAH